MQTKAKLIFSLALLLGAGCPSAACAQVEAALAQAAGQKRQAIADSVDCRQLIAALGDVKSAAFHSDEKAVAEALGRMIAGSTDPADEDLKICARHFWGSYCRQQLRQDVVACMLPYYLEAFGGNEEDLKVALAGMLQGDGQVLLLMDRTARDFAVEIYKAMQAGKALRKNEVAVLSDFLQQEKRKLSSVEDPQAYEAAIVVAGYGDFLQQTVGSLLPEGDVQSKKVQKLLGTTLPEVFARKLRARGVAPKRLWPLLINSPAYVALHETLFRAFFNCNREAMLEGIKEKCRVWMLPYLAEAKEKEQKRKEEEEEWKQKQLASQKERMENVLSLEQLGESAQPPGFPGGETALAAYIGQNIKYPQSALENEIQGTVLLRFVVLEDGRIGDVVITRGLDPACDKEAVRVVKTLPNFNPGQLDGEPVKVWYTLPDRFLIQ